jgi:hypothetical protein
MANYADIEIGLHHRDSESYAVELRFTHPDSDGDMGLGQRLQPVARLDFPALRAVEDDELAYGRQLSAGLFADPAFQAKFAEMCGAAKGKSLPLRVRLFIGASAAELHSLRWETLVDPRDPDVVFATSENITFSRYLSSPDARLLRLRAKSRLRALVAIANPSDLEQFGLAPVDVAGEWKRAQTSLGDISATPLHESTRVTMNNLTDKLRAGYDILYLVCHGALVEGEEPRLWLEDQNENGNTIPVSGNDLALRLKELQQPPRLIVLASCESAGTGAQSPSGHAGALAALGPRLAEAGVPAVLAMQGKISMATVEQFMPKFFSELQTDGVIDRALAVARGTVRTNRDWWMPVLFMRLKSGRIWYVPGYGAPQDAMQKWPALCNSIKDGICTPILGPGVTDALTGSRWELAQRLAEKHHFPLAPHDRDDLPQVTQFLAVQQDALFVPREVILNICQELLNRSGPDWPEELRAIVPEKLSRLELIEKYQQFCTAAWEQQRKADPIEPHTVLAKLPFPIYLTTNQDSLLAHALRNVGKKPEIELCRWNEELVQLPSLFDRDRTELYIPSLERPLVYHMFGRIEKPPLFHEAGIDPIELRTVAFTEDDYFDFLLGVDRKTADNEVIPNVVRRALADRALMFIGFQMDDWNFRVLFRYIMSKQGGRRRNKYTHIAVQINPEEGRVQSPERARRFLESYFQGADISVYWGAVEDFVHELHEQYFG